MNLPTFGNEGDDWIEIGTSDGAAATTSTRRKQAR